MNEKTRIEKLSDALSKMNQEEKLSIIHDLTWDLPATEVSEAEMEARNICEELELEEDRLICAVQVLAKSLDK